MRTKQTPIALQCLVCQKPFLRRFSYHRHLVEKRGITRVYCSRRCKENAEQRANYEGIRERYESGSSIADIASEWNVAPETIRKRLIQSGVIIRNRAAHLSTDRNPTKGKGHTEAAKVKLRESTRAQFSDPAARERHALLTCKQIAKGRTGKAYNKLESRVAKMLDAEGIEYVQQHRVGRFLFDFFLPATNTLLEVHGTFWHADPRFYSPDGLASIQKGNIENDRRKAERAKKDGYALRVIWEADVP